MRRRLPRRSSGFTLIELLVALFITIEIIIAVLALFDLNNKLARVQTNVAEMQQSHRIAQYDLVRMARMTGRGAYLARAAYANSPKTYDALGTGVLDNVTGDVGILGGTSDPSTNPKILPGTDVLRIRAAISSPVYQVNTVDPAAFTLVDVNADQIPESGTIILSNISPTGVPQNLSPFADILVTLPTDQRRPEALLIDSPLGDHIYAVVELDPGASSITGPATDPTSVTLGFLVSGGSMVHETAYTSLDPIDLTLVPPAPRYPKALKAISSVTILEEYRYYIRELHVDPANAASDLAPRLSRARVFPGSNVAYGPTAGGGGNLENLRADIADNIYDLQLAIGLDTTLPADEQVVEATPPGDDEWLFNAVADDPTNAKFRTDTPIYYLRISTLALTDRRDPKYQAPLIGRIEDHDYTANVLNTSAPNRMFRHRLVQTVVGLRNY
jgi:Tfp pilus assembly protein PilV